MNESMFEISGYEKSDLNRLNFSEIIHPDIPQKYIEDTWGKLNNGELWTGNTKFISKTKDIFYLKNTILKLQDLMMSILQ